MAVSVGSRRKLFHLAVLVPVLTLLPVVYVACGEPGGHQDFSLVGEAARRGDTICTPAAAPGAAAPAAGANVVTYEEQVKPQIFQRVCGECHGRVAGLPNWLDYAQAVAKKDAIRFRVTNKIMPPASATINSLTAEEIKLVQDWVDSGAVRTAAGGGAAAPAPGGTNCDPAPVAGNPPSAPSQLEPPPAPLDPPPPERPTYVEHLKPNIFKPICGACHGVRPELPNWQNYDEAADRAEKIARKISDGEMPPPDSGIKLTDNQKELILKWVRDGAPYQ